MAFIIDVFIVAISFIELSILINVLIFKSGDKKQKRLQAKKGWE